MFPPRRCGEIWLSGFFRRVVGQSVPDDSKKRRALFFTIMSEFTYT